MNPFRVPAVELRRHPGTRREVAIAAPVGELVVAGTTVGPDDEVAVEGVLESIDGGVTFSGTVAVPWRGQCRRCLEPVTGTAVAEVSEVFEVHPVEGETYPLHTDAVDLLPAVRDAALLALPLAPLCAERCEGPAPERFPATPGPDGDDASEDREPAPDPRWAKLGELRFDP